MMTPRARSVGTILSVFILTFFFKGKKGSREFKPVASEEFQVTCRNYPEIVANLSHLRTSS